MAGINFCNSQHRGSSDTVAYLAKSAGPRKSQNNKTAQLRSAQGLKDRQQCEDRQPLDPYPKFSCARATHPHRLQTVKSAFCLSCPLGTPAGPF